MILLWERLTRRRRDDDGAILIIAILVVTVVALVTGFVLTQGDTSLRATVTLRSVAGSTYAADGAAAVAINALRTGYSPGDPNGAGPDEDWAFNNSFDGTGCFGKDAGGNAVHTLDLPAFYPATGRESAPTSAAVECVAEDATGAQGSPVPINNANKPGNAILTLGTGGETGLYAKPQGNSIGQFRVQGGIWSNSDIVADNGSIVSSESIRARTGCTPRTAMVAPTVDCGAGASPDPSYLSDPVLAGTGVPPLRRPPTSCGTVVTFEPGYYDDANALTDLTNNNGCRNSTFWFKPGTYYFDFHNGDGDPQSLKDVQGVADNSNQTQWTVGVGTLLAGTPVNASGAVIAGPGANPQVPGACQSPINDVDTVGVQFVFGGASQLKFDGNAKGEICGSYHTNRPPIAFYGLRDGTASPTVLSGPAALTASSVTVSPAGTFSGADPAALAQPGGTEATWTRSSAGTQTATITMNGFAPGTAIPTGSVLTGATLQVKHREASTDSKLSIDPEGPTPVFTQQVTLPRRATSQTDSINLATYSPTLWTALRREVHDNGFTGARLDYLATLKKDETATLDSVRLELTYYVPQFRAQTDAGYGGPNCLKVGGGCNVLSTPTNYAGQLYVQGTTYAPVSRIDLNLSGQVTAQVMRFGVIARSLAIRETGSFEYEGPVIELPDNSPGWGFNGTIVQLKVYVCPAQTTCSASGRPALKVRVQMWDPGGTPDPPGRQVSVLSWSHDR